MGLKWGYKVPIIISIEAWTLAGTCCSQQHLTLAGSVRQSFTSRDSCTPCAWETYDLKLLQGQGTFCLKHKLAFETTEYGKQIRAEYNNTLLVCIMFPQKLHNPGLRPVSQTHWALPPAPCVTTGFSLLLKLLRDGLSSCSDPQLPSSQLLTASASSLWPFDGYLGNPKFSQSLFKANSIHMINSSCRPQKKKNLPD